jgi:hypothetical protein
MQCTAEAELLKQNALHGINLFRSTRDAPGWPVGWYGLVESNDPFLVFPSLAVSPVYDLSEEALTQFLDTDASMAQEQMFQDAVIGLEIQPKPSLMQVHFLVESCMKSGYNPDEHGTRVEMWLVQHLAKLIS